MRGTLGFSQLIRHAHNTLSLSLELAAMEEKPRPGGGVKPSTVKSDQGAFMGDRDLVDKDKLILRGLQFHGFHGVKHEEKTLGQKFVVDVDAWLDLSIAGKTDGLSDTLSYTDIYRIVKDVVEGPSQNLLESVAHLIANTTLLKCPQISAIRVKVGKPHVAIHGTIDYLGVEILRYKRHDSPDSS